MYDTMMSLVHTSRDTCRATPACLFCVTTPVMTNRCTPLCTNISVVRLRTPTLPVLNLMPRTACLRPTRCSLLYAWASDTRVRVPLPLLARHQYQASGASHSINVLLERISRAKSRIILLKEIKEDGEARLAVRFCDKPGSGNCACTKLLML